MPSLWVCGTEMSKYAPNKQHNQRNGFECLLRKVGYDENTYDTNHLSDLSVT